MELKGKTVLVTGAGGFIGSHLVESLLESHCKVKALVHYNSRNDWGNLKFLHEKTLKSIQIQLGDVTDPNCLKKAIRGCQLVFHLAALIGIPYSYIAPKSYVATNITGTLNVLQACLDEEVEKVIHTSTSETYGTAQYTPIDENHPLVGQSPYSATKIAADKIAESFYFSFGLPVAIIRPFNVFGPRQSTRAVIPTIITQILRGNIVKLGALDPIRDFNYVKDTVLGFIKIARCDSSVGEVINIGSGRGLTIQGIFDELKHIIDNKNIQLIVEKKRIRPEKSEVKALLCNFEKARSLIDYEPKYSFEKGLTETIEFFRQFQSHFKDESYTL